MLALAKFLLRTLLKLLYRVEVSGLENYARAGKRVLIVANHTSLLDGILLYLWLPERPTFAINTHIARKKIFRPFLWFVDLFIMDPTSPLSIKSMIKFIREDRKAVIFPEGRITLTGSLMKIYEGPALIADRADAMVLPVAIDGAQFSTFSYMKGKGRVVWFPKIKITILPPEKISLPDDIQGHERRNRVAMQLQDIMFKLTYASFNFRTTIFGALLHASKRYGKNRLILEDIERQPLSYHDLITRAVILGRHIRRSSDAGEHIGVLLPNVTTTMVIFVALQYIGRIPAMLNYTGGIKAMQRACNTAGIKTIYTSRKFIHNANLQELAAKLEQQVTLVYLEDLREQITLIDKLAGVIAAKFIHRNYPAQKYAVNPDNPALVLFTSGSEGNPKGVVLSHSNILSNYAQVSCHVDFQTRDVLFSCLPLFHSFGLNAGSLMPLFGGSRVFLYPTPLHYRNIPELIYELGATILFGTNTFLKNYAQHAHPYDFYNLRYVVAGAEKLRRDTQQMWMEKFGIRILQGYGVTEASPVIAVNTPMANKIDTVGRFLTGIQGYLKPINGIEHGGRLVVKGPNIMLGYLLAGEDNIQPPETERGPGWYDTGDIADIDEEGFISILGRAKRFAKIGGEMVSLTAVEELAMHLWPGFNHAAVNLPDEKKGEKIILVTENENATRRHFQEYARKSGVGELYIPRRVVLTDALPLLGTGKTDYNTLTELVIAEDKSESGWLNKLTYLVKKPDQEKRGETTPEENDGPRSNVTQEESDKF